MPSAKDLAKALDRFWVPQLSAYQSRLARVQVNMPGIRRFLVARMGSTGSTWFSKLLDSHPDVLCSHEGILMQVYPAKSYGTDEMLRYIEYFSSDAKHGAYRTLGDVGSAWAELFPLISFTKAILVRHPARVLQTRLDVWQRDQSFSDIPVETADYLRELWDIDLVAQSPIDRIFLNDIWSFVMQLWAISYTDAVIVVERLRDPGYCQKILKTLTDIEYPPALIEYAIAAPQNRRSGKESKSIAEIVENFTERQRGWYNLMLTDVVGQFGYELLNDYSPPD
jgi:hypothetical protein